MCMLDVHTQNRNLNKCQVPWETRKPWEWKLTFSSKEVNTKMKEEALCPETQKVWQTLHFLKSRNDASWMVLILCNGVEFSKIFKNYWHFILVKLKNNDSKGHRFMKNPSYLSRKWWGCLSLRILSVLKDWPLNAHWIDKPGGLLAKVSMWLSLIAIKVLMIFPNMALIHWASLTLRWSFLRLRCVVTAVARGQPWSLSLVLNMPTDSLKEHF